MNFDISQLQHLSNADKLRIVTQLWDEIAASNEPIDMPLDAIDEASRRLQELDADPTLAIDDEEFWRRVDRR